MSNCHYIIRPRDWLTETAWGVVEREIESMPSAGGIVMLAMDAAPNCRNYLNIGVVTLTGRERQAVRRAILKARTEPSSI